MKTQNDGLKLQFRKLKAEPNPKTNEFVYRKNRSRRVRSIS